MKYVGQFAVIIFISFLGEVLHALVPLPIPGSIYGMMLMLAGLWTGLISLEKVKDTGRFLVEIMPLMFIPSAVGIMTSFEVLRPVLLPFVVIVVVSTFLVMGVSGLVTQALLRHGRGKRGGEAE